MSSISFEYSKRCSNFCAAVTAAGADSEAKEEKRPAPLRSRCRRVSSRAWARSPFSPPYGTTSSCVASCSARTLTTETGGWREGAPKQSGAYCHRSRCRCRGGHPSALLGALLGSFAALVLAAAEEKEEAGAAAEATLLLGRTAEIGGDTIAKSCSSP